MTELAQFIQATPLCDTHEHLRKEREFVEQGPDVLQDLFGNYVQADLVVAGASPQAVKRLLDPSDDDLAGRFAGIQRAWQAVKHTGYGEAVRLIAQHAYGIDELTPETVETARANNQQMRRPGERLRILKEVGNLDHVQIDDFVHACVPDSSGPDFFLYDLSWRHFCNGVIEADIIHHEVGVEVKDASAPATCARC